MNKKLSFAHTLSSIIIIMEQPSLLNSVSCLPVMLFNISLWSSPRLRAIKECIVLTSNAEVILIIMEQPASSNLTKIWEELRDPW